MNKKISLTIKITDACNLRCKHCYYRKSKYDVKKLDKNHFSKFLSIVLPEYDTVTVSFHGGEPTFYGKKTLQEYVQIVKEYANKFNKSIPLAIQTNGTLIDEEFINFFKEEKISPMISYDGSCHDIIRNNTSNAVLNTQKLIEDNGMYFRCTMVVSKFNINSLIDDYKFLNKGNRFLKLIPYCGEKDNEFSLSEYEYLNKMKELFDYWVNDSTCTIILDPLERMIKDYFAGSSIMCANSFCAGKILSLEPDGRIGFCAMKIPEEYTIKTIDEIESVNDIFESEPFKKLYASASKRSNKCKQTCELYTYCKGGCNLNSYYENGIEEIRGFTCVTFKELFSYIVDFIKNSESADKIENILNPRVKALLTNNLKS